MSRSVLNFLQNHKNVFKNSKTILGDREDCDFSGSRSHHYNLFIRLYLMGPTLSSKFRDWLTLSIIQYRLFELLDHRFCASENVFLNIRNKFFKICIDMPLQKR